MIKNINSSEFNNSITNNTVNFNMNHTSTSGRDSHTTYLKSEEYPNSGLQNPSDSKIVMPPQSQSQSQTPQIQQHQKAPNITDSEQMVTETELKIRSASHTSPNKKVEESKEERKTEGEKKDGDKV